MGVNIIIIMRTSQHGTKRVNTYDRTKCWTSIDEVRFVLDQHTELDFYSASSLKQQSMDRHVAPLRHIILIPSRPVFALSP